MIFSLQEINILCSKNQLRVLQNLFLYLNYQHTPSISTSCWQFLFPDNFCFSGFFPKITISYFLHQQGCCRVDSPGFWSCQGAPSRWAVFTAALSHRGSPGWPRGLAVLAVTVVLGRAVPLQGLGVALLCLLQLRAPAAPPAWPQFARTQCVPWGAAPWPSQDYGVCSKGLGPWNIHKSFALKWDLVWLFFLFIF